jgi:hypothetical protein
MNPFMTNFHNFSGGQLEDGNQSASGNHPGNQSKEQGEQWDQSTLSIHGKVVDQTWAPGTRDSNREQHNMDRMILGSGS